MTALQLFTFQAHEVRVKGDLENPWFCLPDVCSVLGLSNPTVVSERLDDEDKAKFDLGLPGHNPWFISESGLYSVVFRSDKPEAKRFSKWVRSEVLPQIRKTGQFGNVLNQESEASEFWQLIDNAIARNLDVNIAIDAYHRFNQPTASLDRKTSKSHPKSPAAPDIAASKEKVLSFVRRQTQPVTTREVARNFPSIAKQTQALLDQLAGENLVQPIASGRTTRYQAVR